MKFTENPLKTCKLRTARLASVKGAMFGMTRKNKDGTPRAHQGVDLASDIGYRVYAVENGIIANVSKSNSGYGYTVTLAVKSNLFAFYAHLDRIDVKLAQNVIAGQQIGLTGSTGNAKGMTTITTGGHLHFEVRDRLRCGLGLSGRLDPLKYIELSK